MEAPANDLNPESNNDIEMELALIMSQMDQISQDRNQIANLAEEIEGELPRQSPNRDEESKES